MACTHAHLGLATTRELLDELRARFEIHAAGGLDYRTVDGEKIASSEQLVGRWEVGKNGWDASDEATREDC